MKIVFTATAIWLQLSAMKAAMSQLTVLFAMPVWDTAVKYKAITVQSTVERKKTHTFKNENYLPRRHEAQKVFLSFSASYASSRFIFKRSA